jgi:hypothetical protein
MLDEPATTKPAAMEGHGGYNRRSQVQAGSSAPAIAMLERAAKLVPQTASIVIADYGSSQGHNSLAPLATAIEVLRERIGLHRAISVVHTDLPQNDFTSLFQTLNNDPESYLRRGSDTFAMAVGRSFYEQILPSNSVTLGWSSWAVQWLSRTPAPIPDHVQEACSDDAPTRAAFSTQAAEDWQSFLRARGRELCPGGRLVVLTMAVDGKGEFGYRPLMQAMYATLVEMVNSGSLRPDELHRMAIPTVGRSREDFLAPFHGEGIFAGLRVEEVDIFHGEDHVWLEFEQHRDPHRFAAQWAAFSRASVFPTLSEGLDNGHDDLRAAKFVELLEAGIISRLSVRPERMLIPLCKLLLARESDGISA